MKVLGIAERSYPHGKSFICEISEGELVKVINKAGYREADEEMKKIRVGDDYPIAEGYDFRAAIVESTRTMDAAFKSFQKVAPVMTKFAGLIAQTEAAHEETA